MKPIVIDMPLREGSDLCDAHEATITALRARVRQLEDEAEWLNRQLLDREYVIEEMRKERV